MSLPGVMQDLRYAARGLRRSPGFTVVATAVLALGIGATTAVFSLVNAIVLKPLPFVEPDRLVVLWEDFTSAGATARVEPTPASYVAWDERAGSFEDIALLRPITYNLTGDGDPEKLDATRTTPNLFELLGLQPILGRTFAADDDGARAEPVAVISEDLWVRRFGADPALLGRSIRLDGLSRTVIGVVPGDFRFPGGGVDVWVPGAFTPSELAQRDSYFYYVVARLADGTSLAQAQAELGAIASTRDANIGATVALLHEHLSRGTRPMLGLLLAAVGAVLLIACANVANLLLARGAGRRRELALRKSLGAADGRILRQLLTESGVLAALGVVAGVALSTLSFDYLSPLVPGTYPAGADPALDWRVLALTAGTALLTVLLFGAGPAFAAARRPLGETLKPGVGMLGGARGGRLRSGLVVAEIALTLVLLAAAGLLLRSYFAVLDVEPGFRHENLLIAETTLASSQYDGRPAARSDFYERVLERVDALPGASAAGYVTYPPLVFAGGRSLISIEGRPPPSPENLGRYITSDRTVSTDYLSMLGVPLIRGRHLDERDTAAAPRAVVINEAMARRHWPDQNPIGARLRIGVGEVGNPWFTVVGVVGAMRQMGLDMPPEPEMYFSIAQTPGQGPFRWPSHLVVRTAGDPMSLADTVRTTIWEVDPGQPVSNVRTMSDVFNGELANRDMQLTLLGAFAVVALVLAAVGLYGVLSYTIAQRTAEIGLRMALGAGHGNVVRGVVRSALLLAALGIVVGLIVTAGMMRLLASFLFGVGPADPVTFSAALGMLLLVTLAASYVPARRAADIDPMTALRTD